MSGLLLCLFGRKRVHTHVAFPTALGCSPVVVLLVGHLKEQLGEALVGLFLSGTVLVFDLDLKHHAQRYHIKQNGQLPLGRNGLPSGALGECPLGAPSW